MIFYFSSRSIPTWTFTFDCDCDNDIVVLHIVVATSSLKSNWDMPQCSFTSTCPSNIAQEFQKDTHTWWLRERDILVIFFEIFYIVLSQGHGESRTKRRVTNSGELPCFMKSYFCSYHIPFSYLNSFDDNYSINEL